MPIPFPLSSYFSSCSFVAASNFGNQILGIASILPSSNAYYSHQTRLLLLLHYSQKNSFHASSIKFLFFRISLSINFNSFAVNPIESSIKTSGFTQNFASPPPFLTWMWHGSIGSPSFEKKKKRYPFISNTFGKSCSSF